MTEPATLLSLILLFFLSFSLGFLLSAFIFIVNNLLSLASIRGKKGDKE